MTVTRASGTATEPRRPTSTPLVWLAAVAASGLALSATYAATGLGVPCAFRAVTGWDCPFCGGTRMGAALLHGDVVGAWTYNPFALICLGLTTTLGAWLVAEHLLSRQGALASRIRGVASRLGLHITPTTVTITVGIVLVAWTLVRNLILGPLP